MIMPFLFNIRDKVRPLNQLTDEQLMQRVAAKDDDRAFDELYHRHARRVMGFFYRQMNRDEERASDLMQDTLMRVWTARQRWNVDTEFLPWLFTIAFNICKNEYRHNGYKADYEQHVLHTQDEDYLRRHGHSTGNGKVAHTFTNKNSQRKTERIWQHLKNRSANQLSA